MNIYRKLMKQGLILFGILVFGIVAEEILDQVGKQKFINGDQLSDKEESLYQATCLEIDRKTRSIYERI